LASCADPVDFELDVELEPDEELQAASDTTAVADTQAAVTRQAVRNLPRAPPPPRRPPIFPSIFNSPVVCEATLDAAIRDRHSGGQKPETFVVRPQELK
jgi:hypothetical protein